MGKLRARAHLQMTALGLAADFASRYLVDENHFYCSELHGLVVLAANFEQCGESLDLFGI